ncbi:MAG: hypothetical protein HOH43_12215 [Candidatus Latescibacteria bacterium]|jgi:hypothetical protein|nr:hypothetical protein [Candidatus Latescibacterota bacterium]
MRRNSFMPVVGIALILLVACGGSNQLTPTKGRPAWIDQGGGFFTGDQGRAFYGVGAASNISSPSLRRTTADVQARADIARIFKTHVADLVKVTTRSVSGGADAASATESTQQFAQSATKAFTSLDLSGSQVVDRYWDATERTQYSLAVMDMNAFSDKITQMNELSETAREAIISNADQVFAELEALDSQ